MKTRRTYRFHSTYPTHPHKKPGEEFFAPYAAGDFRMSETERSESGARRSASDPITI